MSSRFQLLAVTLVLLFGAGGVLFLLFGEEPAAGNVVGFTEEGLETIEEDPADLEAAWEEAEPDSGTARLESTADPSEEGALPGGAAARTLLVLAGRVVDPSGQGIADAEVSLYMRRSLEAMFRGRGPFGRGNRGRGGRGRWQDLFRLKKVAKSVRTGQDGKFVFQGPAFPQSSLDVAVEHRAFAPAVVHREWEAEEGKLQVADIVLSPGGSATGVVVDKAGRPIPDAEVSYEEGGGSGRMGRRGRTPRTLSRLIDPVQTDVQGIFQMDRIPPGEFRLGVEKAKYLPAGTGRLEMKAGATVNGGQITLELGAELRGVVRDQQGRAIPGADVVASGSRQGWRGRGPGRRGRGGMDWRRLFAERKAKTDSRGEFFLDALPQGAIRIAVEHQKYIDEERDPVEPSKTPLVEISMFRRLAVKGVVIDRLSGQAVEHYGIRARQLRDRDRGRGRGGMRFGRRGQGGSERRGGRREDRGRRGGREAPGQAGRRGGQAAPAREGRGRRAGREGGRRDGERRGRGRGGSEARRLSRNNRDSRRATEEAYRKQRLGPSGEAAGPTPAPEAHPGGEFLIEGLQAGNFVFDIDAPGYAKVAEGPVKLERGQKLQSVTFRLDRGSRLEGRVLDRKTGEPIAGARVELFLPPLAENSREEQNPFAMMFRRGRSSQGILIERKRSGQDGRFAFSSHRPGVYKLVASADGRLPHVDASLMLVPGKDSKRYRIELAAGARVFGHVKHGEPDDRFSVVLTHGGGSRHTARVDPETGSYEIAGLQAGEYRASLEKRGDPGDFRRRIATMFAGRNRPDFVLAEGAELRYDLDARDDDLGTVKGLILHNGLPGTGLDVSLSLEEEAGSTGGTNDELRSVARRMSGRFLRDGTNEDGEFEISSVPPGRYTLEIRRGGRGRRGSAMLSEKISVAAGVAFDRQFILNTGGIRFHVTDAGSEKPVGRARISLVLSTEGRDVLPARWRELDSYRRVTVRDGKAEARDLGTGFWLYVVSGQGLVEKVRDVEVRSGDSEERVNVERKAEKTAQPAGKGQGK